MKIPHRNSLAALTALTLGTGSALAQTTNFTGPNSGNNDGWNNVANWDNGIPTGTINVSIPAGRQVMVQDNQTALVTQLYSGTLTLGAGATLNIGYTSGSFEDYRALGTPGTTVITAGAGATFGFNRVPGTVIVPEIQMLGDILIKTGSSTNNVPDLFFDHGIHGAFKVTVDGKSNSELNLSAVNTFSELIVLPTDGNLIEFNATAAGSLSGDVTILSAGNGNPAANLTIDAADAMADTATLSISGTTATLLTVNFDDTIKNLLINGVTQPAGTYGTGQDYDPSWYSGAGVLTVTGAPATYWDIDGTTAGAGGATPAGTWDLNSTANWDTIADGTGAASLWSASAGQAATFAAGSDATGTYAVTVSGTQDIGGLAVEEGDVTLSGDGLQMTSDSLVGIAAGSSLTVSSVISNDSARQLAKNGDGTLTLSGANTYTGQTKLEAGTLSVGSLANAGADSPLGNYPAAGTDGLELFGGMLEYTGATASSDRGFTLKGNSAIHISAASTALTLGDSQAIDASGSLNITGGAGSSLALGAFYVSKASSTLNPTTASLSIASIGLNEPYGGGALTFTLGGTATGNEVTGAINRVNTHPNNWDGCHDIIKEGSGDWTLSGSVACNGSHLSVNDGTLLVNGSINNQLSSFNVNGPGVLGGGGSIAEPVTVNAGGGLAPGTSAGTLTFTNNLTISAVAGVGGGTLAFELDALAGTSDQIAVSGTLSIGTDLLRFTDFTFTDLGGLEVGTYTLITSGTLSGTVDAANASGSIGSLTGTLQVNGNNLELVVSGAGGSPYETWATGGELFEDDENGDGVSNGMAFLLGAADPDADALGLLPTGTENGSGGLVLTFSMLNAANRGAASMSTQHSADLGNTDAWDAAGNEETVPETTSTVGVVDFVITPNGSLNDVVATIPVGEANGGDALFGRLKATE